MERNIIDGSHSKDSMEIMDKLMKEQLNQEEVIIRTSESENNNEEDKYITKKEGEEKNDKHKRR